LQFLCQAEKIKLIVIKRLEVQKGTKKPENVQIIGYFNFLNFKDFFALLGRWRRSWKWSFFVCTRSRNDISVLVVTSSCPKADSSPAESSRGPLLRPAASSSN